MLGGGCYAEQILVPEAQVHPMGWPAWVAYAVSMLACCGSLFLAAHSVKM